MKRIGILSLLCLLSAFASALDTGDPAPSFELPGLRSSDKSQISLDAYKGKVVYLDFWASWCAPCKISLPLLNELREQYRAQGKSFEVLAINVDSDPDDGRDFLKDHPVTYPVLQDAAGLTPAQFELIGMPTAFLLDQDGRITMIHEGFVRSDIDMIRQHIDLLLEAAP